MNIKCSHDELVDLIKIIPNPKNPNQHPPEQIDRLAKLIEFQGQRHPIIVSKRSGFVVVGHGRLEAIRKLGWEKAAVNYQDFDNEAQEYAFVVSDNGIAEWAELDLSSINTEMLDLGPDFDVDLLGLKDFEIEPAEKFEAQCDEDEIPEFVEPKTKPGDIYKLGNHRLMCGDSTSIDAVEKLMNGEKADMVFTDPPYGMNAVSKSGVLSANYKTDIMGDDNTDVARDSFNLCQGIFPEAKQVWWGANYYSSNLPDSECWIVWDKNNGGSDQTDCELAWTNFRSVVRQFTKASEKVNRVHPTQKPVELIEWTFEKFKFSKGVVLDLFGGSGSTLIGCEKMGLKSYHMEMDPRFADVIVARWEKYTGQKAELLNGQT